MPSRIKTSAKSATSVEIPRERYAIPSWLVSTICHAGLLVLLASTLEGTPRGALVEETRSVGIVLKQQDDAQEQPASAANDPAPTPGEPVPAAGSASAGDDSDRFDLAPPSDPTQALPKLANTIGPGAPSAAPSIPAAGDLTQGASGDRNVTGGYTRTSVFGITGEGYKFVYVFDRSGSMGGSGRTALDAAKAELLKSLDDLSDIHQFEIVFYNERPTVMQVNGQGRLQFATQENKAAARQFVASIPADGTTDHEQALLLALRLQPDVIFFLTDADEPMLNRAQLARIRQLNGGRTSINSIEFGLGPSLASDNFLTRLAKQNGGQHVYYDITQLRRRS